MRCGPTFRLARTHPARARSSGSETLSRSRSLVGYTIDTHESEVFGSHRVRASLRGRQLGVVYPLRILLFDKIQLASATHQSAHVFAPNIARARLKSGDYPFFINFGEIEPRLETSFQKQLHAEPEHLRHLLDVVSDLQELLGLPGSELLDVPQTLDRAQKVNFPVREFAQWQR